MTMPKLFLIGTFRYLVQSAVLEKQDELASKQAVVNSLEDEMAVVSEKLSELESSTDDLKALSFDSSEVTNQRENYEVTHNIFIYNISVPAS